MQSLILLLPLIAIFIYFPSLTYYINILAAGVLDIETSNLKEVDYLFQSVYLIGPVGRYPGTMQSVYVFIASLAAIIILLKSKIAVPIVSYLVYALLILLVSAVYFVFIPFSFPYNILAFSDLYIKLQVSWWIITPVLMLVSLLPLPVGLLSKLSVSLLTLLYAIIFGMVRYVVLIYILREYSYLYMAVLLFAFGPLVDFIYVVGIFSVFVSGIAGKTKSRLREWNWLY
ncbi:MAG: hypothetical protein NTX32_03825 [Candidatus Firestonebacteria bacterium]|nr:hypothetical protein [Candidatus Firestonebacteria bacterium]